MTYTFKLDCQPILYSGKTICQVNNKNIFISVPKNSNYYQNISQKINSYKEEYSERNLNEETVLEKIAEAQEIKLYNDTIYALKITMAVIGSIGLDINEYSI